MNVNVKVNSDQIWYEGLETFFLTRQYKTMVFFDKTIQDNGGAHRASPSSPQEARTPNYLPLNV